MAVEMKIEANVKKDDGILKLSASSMKTYSQCPMKYYFQYIQKAPRKEFDHFTLGNFCHKVLEIFHSTYLKNTTISIKEIMTKSFKAARRRKEFRSIKPELLKEAQSLLKDYLVSISGAQMPTVKGIEKSFELEIEKGLVVRGFLDRVDLLNGGKFRIVDYKTTKNVKYLDPFQLLIYGLWLNNEYPDIDEFEGSYILLRHKSTSKDYNFNKKDIEGCKKKIITFAYDINNNTQNNIWKPNPSILCRWCDFQQICPVNKGW